MIYGRGLVESVTETYTVVAEHPLARWGPAFPLGGQRARRRAVVQKGPRGPETPTTRGDRVSEVDRGPGYRAVHPSWSPRSRRERPSSRSANCWGSSSATAPGGAAQRLHARELDVGRDRTAPAGYRLRTPLTPSRRTYRDLSRLRSRILCNRPDPNAAFHGAGCPGLPGE